MISALGPVGDKQQQVIIHAYLLPLSFLGELVMSLPKEGRGEGPVTDPNRKSQIITNHRTYLPALQLNNQFFFACRIMILLFGITKQMPLVVSIETPVRSHPDQ